MRDVGRAVHRAHRLTASSSARTPACSCRRLGQIGSGPSSWTLGCPRPLALPAVRPSCSRAPGPLRGRRTTGGPSLRPVPRAWRRSIAVALLVWPRQRCHRVLRRGVSFRSGVGLPATVTMSLSSFTPATPAVRRESRGVYRSSDARHLVSAVLKPAPSRPRLARAISTPHRRGSSSSIARPELWRAWAKASATRVPNRFSPPGPSPARYLPGTVAGHASATAATGQPTARWKRPPRPAPSLPRTRAHRSADSTCARQGPAVTTPDLAGARPPGILPVGTAALRPPRGCGGRRPVVCRRQDGVNSG